MSEERLKALEARIETVEKENRRLKSIQEVQNLVSKMCYMQEAHMWEERYYCLAQKTPGVTVEIGARGVFEGFEHCRETMITHEMNFVNQHAAAVRKAYPDKEFEKEYTGMLESQLVGTPVIVVAGDGETARGQWMSMMIGAKARDGKPMSSFVWWKIAADFVREDGEWKVWHLRMDPMAMDSLKFAETMGEMPYQKPGSEWVNNHAAAGAASWPAPDKTITNMYYSYRVDTTPQYYPAPPEPYKTFDEIENW